MNRRIKLPGPVADIYRAVAELERAHPGRHFTPDGHLVGSLGEVIVREALGVELLPASQKGHDARCPTRGDVQIKITARSSIALRGPCNHLIALKIVSPEEAELSTTALAPVCGSWPGTARPRRTASAG